MKLTVDKLEVGMKLEYKTFVAEIIQIDRTLEIYPPHTKLFLLLDGEDEISKVFANDLIIDILDIGDIVEWEDEIDVSRLPFTAWFKISQSMKVYTNVAVSRWIDATDYRLLKKLTYEQWREIARTAEYSPNWASNKYAEYRER